MSFGSRRRSPKARWLSWIQSFAREGASGHLPQTTGYEPFRQQFTSPQTTGYEPSRTSGFRLAPLSRDDREAPHEAEEVMEGPAAEEPPRGVGRHLAAHRRVHLFEDSRGAYAKFDPVENPDPFYQTKVVICTRFGWGLGSGVQGSGFMVRGVHRCRLRRVPRASRTFRAPAATGTAPSEIMHISNVYLYLSIYPSIYLDLYVSKYFSIYIYIYPSIYLSIYLGLYIYLYEYVCIRTYTTRNT